MTTKYCFVGEGSSIPGLPHELTEEEAKAAGLADVLKAAIANGNYVPADGRTVSTETAAAPEAGAKQATPRKPKE